LKQRRVREPAVRPDAEKRERIKEAVRRVARKRRLEVPIRFADPGLPDTTWILELDQLGLRARKKGSRKNTAVRASWKSIIGGMLIANGGG
jgi:hypothetical protein